MGPLARSLFACACTTLLSLASGNVLALDVRSLDLLAPVALPSDPNLSPLVRNCTILQMGRQGSGMRVVSYDDDMPSFLIPKDRSILLPKVPDFGFLQGAKITACNPTGVAPFVIANDGNNISAEVHCSFVEKPERCPLGLDVHIEEYYALWKDSAGAKLGSAAP